MSPDEIAQSLRVILSHSDTAAEAGLAMLGTDELRRLYVIVRGAFHASVDKEDR